MSDGLEYDLVVAGSGVAGLSTAVAFLQESETAGRQGRVAVLERGREEDAPGNSRWTGGYLRMADATTVAPGFVEDMVLYSTGDLESAPARHLVIERDYFNTLAREAPNALRWLSGLGVAFEKLPTIFLAMSGPRLLPVGGGAAVVRELTKALRQHGGEIIFQATATRLDTDEHGRVCGVYARHGDGHLTKYSASSVVLATGGFQGNAEMMACYIGPHAGRLSTIAPGGAMNKGEGIRMALAVGAQASGQWDMIHAEPTDPRSMNPEAVLMVYPYGVLVDRDGHRFVDEGYDTVQETFEDIAFKIYRSPGQLAYLLADQKLLRLEGIDRAILTDKGPYTAPSIERLSRIANLPVDQLVKTVNEYNEACRPGNFSEKDPDGLHTEGLDPPKSNWARPLDEPPYLAWPVSCSVVFTFGGVRTDTHGQVLSADNIPIPNLYAAGEMTGIYYNKYPGATSFLRSIVFGRLAGIHAANR